MSTTTAIRYEVSYYQGGSRSGQWHALPLSFSPEAATTQQAKLESSGYPAIARSLPAGPLPANPPMWWDFTNLRRHPGARNGML